MNAGSPTERLHCQSDDHAAVVSRRRFAGGVFAATAFALFPETGTGENGRTQALDAELGPKPEDLSVTDWNEVRARYSNLLRVYGDRLSLEEKHHAVRILTANQHMLASIRSFKVQNGDPSACTLRLYDQSNMHSSPNGI
jgi:hypothetical protein